MNRVRYDLSKLDKKKLVIILILTCVILSVFHFLLNRNEVQKNREVVKPEVLTYTVQRKDMMRRISLYGETIAEANIDIAPKYTGRIKDVRVSLGQVVHKGDVLLVQDTGDLDLSILQNNAASRQAEADAKETMATYQALYDKVNANYQHDKTNYERYATLYDQGAISKEELDKVSQQMIDSKSALDTLLNQRMAEETPASVESKLAAWEKSQKGEAMLAKQRDDLILYAPRDGVIGYRNAEVGTIAQAGQKLLSLVDNSKIYVDCELSEMDIAAVKVGLPVDINIEALGNTYHGDVIYVSPAADAATKHYTVRIELKNIDARVLSGMFARTELYSLQRSQTLTIPKEALMERNGKAYIFVVDAKNQAQEQEVTIGLRNDEEIEILSGIVEGDIVAVSNLARLKNNMSINAISQESQVNPS
mgnify:CR=1 FL=1